MYFIYKAHSLICSAQRAITIYYNIDSNAIGERGRLGIIIAYEHLLFSGALMQSVVSCPFCCPMCEFARSS